METPDFCRCPVCLPSIPPAVGATAAEVAAHTSHAHDEESEAYTIYDHTAPGRLSNSVE
jgi:hypothetical protein